MYFSFSVVFLVALVNGISFSNRLLLISKEAIDYSNFVVSYFTELSS